MAGVRCIGYNLAPGDTTTEWACQLWKDTFLYLCQAFSGRHRQALAGSKFSIPGFSEWDFAKSRDPGIFGTGFTLIFNPGIVRKYECLTLGIWCAARKTYFVRSTSGRWLPRREGSDGSPSSQLDEAGIALLHELSCNTSKTFIKTWFGSSRVCCLREREMGLKHCQHQNVLGQGPLFQKMAEFAPVWIAHSLSQDGPHQSEMRISQKEGGQVPSDRGRWSSESEIWEIRHKTDLDLPK